MEIIYRTFDGLEFDNVEAARSYEAKYTQIITSKVRFYTFGNRLKLCNKDDDFDCVSFGNMSETETQQVINYLTNMGFDPAFIRKIKPNVILYYNDYADDWVEYNDSELHKFQLMAGIMKESDCSSTAS